MQVIGLHIYWKFHPATSIFHNCASADQLIGFSVSVALIAEGLIKCNFRCNILEN